MTEEHMTDGRPLRTIRMFPDYPDTVLWISMPIDYGATGLSGVLVAELETWEQSYYDSLDSDLIWVPETAARTFAEEGVRLARLVAAEIGPQFVVEISSSEDDAEIVRIRAESGSPMLRCPAASSSPTGGQRPRRTRTDDEAPTRPNLNA